MYVERTATHCFSYYVTGPEDAVESVYKHEKENPITDTLVMSETTQ